MRLDGSVGLPVLVLDQNMLEVGQPEMRSPCCILVAEPLACGSGSDTSWHPLADLGGQWQARDSAAWLSLVTKAASNHPIKGQSRRGAARTLPGHTTLHASAARAAIAVACGLGSSPSLLRMPERSLQDVANAMSYQARLLSAHPRLPAICTTISYVHVTTLP